MTTEETNPRIPEHAKPIHGGEVVKNLQLAIRDENWSIGLIPGSIATIIREGYWRRRIVPQTRQEAEFCTFVEFVTAALPEGLGTTVDTLKKYCREDLELLDLIDRETENGIGVNQYTMPVNNIHALRPTGTSPSAALRRLRKSRPDLHQRVLSGEVSPHGAMVEAGFRKQTITIPLCVPDAARILRNRFTEAELIELKEML